MPTPRSDPALVLEWERLYENLSKALGHPRGLTRAKRKIADLYQVTPETVEPWVNPRHKKWRLYHLHWAVRTVCAGAPEPIEVEANDLVEMARHGAYRQHKPPLEEVVRTLTRYPTVFGEPPPLTKVGEGRYRLVPEALERIRAYMEQPLSPELLEWAEQDNARHRTRRQQ